LNRKKLSSIVFQDSEKLEHLNGITHKYIVDKIAEEINKVREAKEAELIGLECIIPVEHGFIDVVDEVWIVTADMDTRIKRIMIRSDLSHKEAIDRINSQKSEEEYLKIANKIIYNNGSLPLLEEKIKALVNKNIG
jgi:dephospho-CoA kinase